MKLYFQKIGSGEPFIILHGLFGSSDNWVSIGKHLAEHFSVYLIDMRNHGKSPHTDKFGYDNMALDVLEFLQDHNLKNVILLGHSMGGKIAMKFALEYPMRIKKLIIADIAPKKYKIIHQHIIEALLSINTTKISKREEAESQLSMKIKSLVLRKFLLKNLYRDGNNQYQWKINLKAICNNLDQLGEQVVFRNTYEKDTLFIKGEKSDYITSDDEKEILSLFPKSKFETIPGASHWLHAEKPELFIEEIFQFLKIK